MKFKVSSIQSLFKLNRPSCVRVRWHQWLDSSVGNREKLSKSPLNRGHAHQRTSFCQLKISSCRSVNRLQCFSFKRGTLGQFVLELSEKPDHDVLVQTTRLAALHLDW